MYMLQQQSEALSSSASNRSSSDDESCDSDNDYPNEDFEDEEKPEYREALQVSSVDSLFHDSDDNDNDHHGGSRSSGALIMGKKSKPDRINLRSTSEQEADDRLDNEYGMSGPSKLSRDTSGGSFRLHIAKIKTIFDTSESDIRYHHLGLAPPTLLERNTSTSSQNNMVDLELAPSHRRHTVTEIPSVNWDLSKTAWSQHIQQSAFDASSRPSIPADGDWEAPTNNDVVYENNGWKSSMYWPRSKHEKMQLCWWIWTVVIFFVGVVVMMFLIMHSSFQDHVK